MITEKRKRVELIIVNAELVFQKIERKLRFELFRLLPIKNFAFKIKKRKTS
jgi:hypothetical protein